MIHGMLMSRYRESEISENFQSYELEWDILPPTPQPWLVSTKQGLGLAD